MEVLEKLRFHSITRFQFKTYKEGVNKHIEKRPHYGFIFCIQGSAMFIYGNKKYKCDQKHVILVPKNCTYDFHINSDNIFPIIDFELDDGFFDEVYSIDCFESNTFYKNFLKMEKRYLYNLESRELMGLSELYDITARLNGYGHYDHKYDIIKPCEQYIRENVYKEIKMCEVAKKANISEVYFRRLFKEKYHFSPLEYIEEMRMHRAKELLISDENLNISEIAIECGYDSVYAFSRAFKNMVGMSPNKFRKMYTVSK